MKVDLDAPAFGANAQKIEDSTSESAAEVSQTEKVEQESTTPSEESKEAKTSEESPKEEVGKKEEEESVEQEVPYSRFKTISDARREAEAKVAELERERESWISRREEPSKKEVEDDPQLLNYMITLYGDNENTRKAYKIELERVAYLEERAEKRAADRAERLVEERESREQNRIAENEQVIDDSLSDLQAYIGRNLTDNEQSEILDIVGEYTPKDHDGNYSGDLLSFDKAYEIYEMRNQRQAQVTRKARSVPTRLTGTNTDGEPSGKEKSDKDFNPLDWNAYRRRI